MNQDIHNMVINIEHAVGDAMEDIEFDDLPKELQDQLIELNKVIERIKRANNPYPEARCSICGNRYRLCRC